MFLTTPFLTDLDERAKLKGSRDPLGAQPIWVRLGRRVIGNLTSASRSVRDFTATLLGYAFVERAAEKGRELDELLVFLKWEQLAAYARALKNDERGFPGTERVRARLVAPRVPLGAGVDAQILANQKIYGLWGIYTSPARASGLLERDPTRLTPSARALVKQHLWRELDANHPRTVGRILERLTASPCHLELQGSRDAGMLEAIAAGLRSPGAAATKLYREHLLAGGPADEEAEHGTQGRQRLLAALLAERFPGKRGALEAPEVLELAKAARGKGEVGDALGYHLERIRAAELVLAPTVALFEYAMQCDGQPLSSIAARVRESWPKATLRAISQRAIEELGSALRFEGEGAESEQRWFRLAEALRAADYEAAIELALAQNAAVMRVRSAAAPWAEVRAGVLAVRFRDAHAGLPAIDPARGCWRHSYFLDSLRAIITGLRGGR